MRRSIPEVIRRGLDSALANWQLLLLRFAENIVFAFIAIATALAVLVPMFVSIGLSLAKFRHIDEKAEDAAAEVIAALTTHWMVFVYAFVAVIVLLIVLSILHAFVIAGCAQTYVDAERAGNRRVFSMERWLDGGRRAMWPVFWIYFDAFGAACTPILVVAVITLAATAAMYGSAGALVVSCLGLLLILVIATPAFIVASVWAQKAIIVAVRSNLGAKNALRVAWQEIRSDFGRHFAVAFIMIVISIGGAATLSMFSVMFSMPGSRDVALSLMFAPARIALSMVQGVYTAAVGLWMLACFAALDPDSK